MASPVRLERNGPILEITLDRPPANAIDLDVGRACTRPSASFATTWPCGSALLREAGSVSSRPVGT